jgi:hypothetical protein
METTTDLYFKWPGILSSDELFIELNYNLRQKGEYDRLVGQIEQINPKKHKLIFDNLRRSAQRKPDFRLTGTI